MKPDQTAAEELHETKRIERQMKFNMVKHRVVHTGINHPNFSHTAMGSSLTTATQKQDL